MANIPGGTCSLEKVLRIRGDKCSSTVRPNPDHSKRQSIGNLFKSCGVLRCGDHGGLKVVNRSLIHGLRQSQNKLPQRCISDGFHPGHARYRPGLIRVCSHGALLVRYPPALVSMTI